MFRNRFLIVSMIVVALLSACAPAGTQPPSTQAATQPPIAPGASQNSPDKFEGLSSGLNNATQARIRTVNEVMGAPNTTVYVNGVPAFNGGIEQKNIRVGMFSGFLYVKPGTYTIALVPEDGTLDQALFRPVDVKVEAGHRYTVAAMGQLEDKDVHPQVVDETAMEAGLGASKTDNIGIDINNLKPADSLTEMAYGKTIAENIKYGEARAMFCASGSPVFVTLANIKAETKKIFESDSSNGWAEPGISLVIPWYGSSPTANYDDVGNASQGTSELNVVDFLAGWEGRSVNIQKHIVTFNTLIKLIDKAGLREQLVNSGPYFLLAPSDEAFAKLSQADLDALLNDPQALKKFLDAYIIDGYYPFGSLSGFLYGHASRTLTNRLGQHLIFSEDNLNDVPIGPNYTVGNGIRVNIIYNLLPSK